jgi:hypothetical protein
MRVFSAFVKLTPCAEMTSSDFFLIPNNPIFISPFTADAELR